MKDEPEKETFCCVATEGPAATGNSQKPQRVIGPMRNGIPNIPQVDQRDSRFVTANSISSLLFLHEMCRRSISSIR
jgi:hypothetical protein